MIEIVIAFFAGFIISDILTFLLKKKKATER